MGYDLNKFLDIQQLPNHLKCLICNLILQDPLQSPCEHYFCSQCITVYLEQTTNHCPHFDEDTVSVKSDKKKSPLKKISSFRKLINKSPKDKLPPLKLNDLKTLPNTVISELNSLKVNCDFHLNGCKEELILSNLSEHVKQCKFINKMKLDSEKKMANNEQTANQPSAEQPEKSKQEDVEQQSTELNKELPKDEPKRKDSENKSTNSESKLVSEEEANSDDFVVISKTSATKSTESVQTNNSDPTIISSKENVSKDDEDVKSIGDTAVEKKKKKKKKKNKAKTDEDAISQSSLKVVSDDSSKKESSKESLVDNNTEELKRALKDAETKTDNLRLMNAQLLGQIKKLKEEKEEITQKLGTDEMDVLKDKIQRLEKENKSQALKIINLIDSNENLNNFIRTLREDQNQLKEKYSSTLNDVQQTLKIFKACKQVN